MSTQSCNPHPIASDGASQRQRALTALDPATNPIDGRGLAEMLGYAERYAAILQYWNDADSRAGDWHDFVAKDVSALVARIGSEDADALRSRFEALKAQVERATGAGLPAAFGDIYAAFADIAGRLDSWYRAAPEALALRRTLAGWIDSTLGATLRRVTAQARRAMAIDPRVPALDVSGLDLRWQLAGVLPDATAFPSGQLGNAQDRADALEQLAQANGSFLQVLQQLQAALPALLQETLKRYPQHQPHMALLLAFLQLFGHAQAHLNRLTAEHLKFYYRRVLGLQPATPVADQVHLVLEPAKLSNGDPRIPKGTQFRAGKDATGVELIYASDEELVLNPARVDATDGLKSIYVEMENGVVKQIHAAADADSADGLGAELSDEEGRWETFGGQQMPYATVGFAVASPMLALGEGERTLVLRFDLDSKPELPTGVDEEAAAKELRLNVKAQGSGAKGWIDLAIHEVAFEDDVGPCLKFRLQLSGVDPALVAYDGELLDGGFATGHPLIRFILDNEGLPAADLPGEVSIAELPEPECVARVAASARAFTSMRRVKAAAHSQRHEILNFEDSMSYFAPGTLVRYGGRLYRSVEAIERAGYRPEHFSELWMPQRTAYPYRYLQGLEIRGLRIEVRVREMRNLILENDQGRLDPAKPFLPFGPQPKAGSAFLIGSPEVFGKQLDEVRLELAWADLPQENFKDHYDEYDISELDSAGNQYFTATAGFLKDGQWEATESQALFDDAGEGADPPPAVERCLKFVGAGGEPLLTRNLPLGDFNQYQAGMRQGFMQLRLDSRDFGHALYPVKLATAAIKQDENSIPNAPYVPLISELKLSYKAHQEISFRGKGVDDFTARVEQLFQIWPFGRREIWPVAEADDAGEVPVERRLLPHFEVTAKDGASQTAEGSLYIGLTGLDLSAGSKNLCLLIQVAEGSADPELPVQPVVWSYLAADVWQDFKTTEILADGTNGLLRSGIIRFVLPQAMTSDNHILPTGRHWLRASVGRHTAAVCRLIALHTQALTASFLDQGNDPAHLASPLPAGTIGKLKERLAAVKRVNQPYASFGGVQREGDDAFNQRVSERLRHKQRAITLFDYERLVLQGFPEIYKVKCINHADRQQEFVPGSVRVIVVPDLRNRNAVDPLRPRASLDTLERIQAYLAERASDFVSLSVTNPDYEAIRIQCQVRFHSGYDQGYYQAQLVTDIQNFLSPWLYDDAADISFGGRIHRSQVLLFIEQRAYVDFVTDLRMDQQTSEGGWLLDVQEAVASHAGSVLVSALAEAYAIGFAVHSCEDEAETPVETEKVSAQAASGFRYLGNTGSRELHDLDHLTPLCHVDMIDRDRRYLFYTIEDAQAMGYDYCAHCFGRERSKR